MLIAFTGIPNGSQRSMKTSSVPLHRWMILPLWFGIIPRFLAEVSHFWRTHVVMPTKNQGWFDDLP
jgi:hypothetical protein